MAPRTSITPRAPAPICPAGKPPIRIRLALAIVWFYDALPPSSLAEPPHVTAALLAVPTWVVVARVFPTDDGGPSPQGAITLRVLWPTHDKTYRRYRPTYG